MSDEIVIQIPMRCSTYRSAINAIAWASIAGIEILGGVWVVLDCIGMTGEFKAFVTDMNPAVAILVALGISIPYVVFIISALAAVVLGCAKAAEWISKFKFKCIPDEDKP